MSDSLILAARGRSVSCLDGIPQLSKEKTIPSFIFDEEDDLADDSSFHTCASHTSLFSSLTAGSNSTSATIADDNLSSAPSSPPSLLFESKSSPAVCRLKPIPCSASSSPIQGTEVFSPRPITRSCFANPNNPRGDFLLQSGSYPLNVGISSTSDQLESQGSKCEYASAPAPLPFPRPPLPPLPTETDIKPRAERKNSRPRLSKSMSFLPKVHFSLALTSEPSAQHGQKELVTARSTTITELHTRPSRPSSRFHSRSHSRPHPRCRPLSIHERTDHRVWSPREYSPVKTERFSSKKGKKDSWTSSVGRFAGRLGLPRRD